MCGVDLDGLGYYARVVWRLEAWCSPLSVLDTAGAAPKAEYAALFSK
jgi:hypothetical protein